MSALVDTIKSVAAFADKENSLTPSLAAVHFRKGEIYSINSRGGARAPFPLKLACGVNAKSLLRALQAVAGEPELVQEDSQLVVKAKGRTARLAASSTRDAPRLERPDTEDWLEVADLSKASRIAWCTEDEDRPHLSGICLQDGSLSATNGHALSMLRGFPQFAKKLGQECILRPEVLVNLPNPVYLSREGSRVFLALDEEAKSFRLSNLIDQQFPPISAVIESARLAPECQVVRKDVLEMLKRAELAGTRVTLEVNRGRLSVLVDQKGAVLEPTLFTFQDSVGFEAAEGPIPEGVIGFNLNYLISMFGSATDDIVNLRFKPSADGGLDPLLIEDSEYTGVLMPMRL